MSYGFIQGVTDNSDITYCPRCGAEIRTCYGDGTAGCSECGMQFGVVEIDDDKDEEGEEEE